MASEKPTGQQTITTSGIRDVEAVELDIKDEAGSLAARALTSDAVDEETSRKVRRKIDIRILPFLCVTYALMFIDKTSLGYSSVYGIIPDNKLQGQDYSWASSIFYFGKSLLVFIQITDANNNDRISCRRIPRHRNHSEVPSSQVPRS